MKYSPFDPAEVEYRSEFGTIVRGYVINAAESPLTGRYRLEIADSPNDSEGKWKYSDECWEVTP